MKLSRPQRRSLLRDCRNRVAPGIFSNDGVVFDAIVALTIILVDVLRAPNGKSRASMAAEEVQTVFDVSVGRHPPAAPVACKKGCYYCCHTFASARPPEVFRIIRMIQKLGLDQDGQFSRNVHDIEQQTRGQDLDNRFEGRLPCVLLSDGNCVVYGSRPLACRGYASTSLEACLKSWNFIEDNIPFPAVYALVKDACRDALSAALKVHGFDWRAYELNSAVRVALDTPDLEARWLDGEPVFSGVQIDKNVRPGLEAVIDGLVKEAESHGSLI